jgi:hypothetical protein
VFILSLAVMLPQKGGELGQSVWIGRPNRLLIVVYSAWLMIVAWQAARLSRLRQQPNRVNADGTLRKVHLGQQAQALFWLIADDYFWHLRQVELPHAFAPKFL